MYVDQSYQKARSETDDLSLAKRSGKIDTLFPKDIEKLVNEIEELLGSNKIEKRRISGALSTLSKMKKMFALYASLKTAIELANDVKKVHTIKKEYFSKDSDAQKKEEIKKIF